MVHINSRGIRDAEYGSQSTPQTTRILALGDSQTFGNGLKLADTWPKQLERQLNAQAGVTRYEVLNGGLPASDTWQHEILLKRLMSIYNPDIVVLAFYVNDIVSKPVSIMSAQGKDSGRVNSRLVYLLKRSVLLLSLRNAYDAIRQIILSGKGFHMQNALLAGESNPVIDKRWKQVEDSLSSMKEVSVRNNASFLVVSLPRRDQVDGHLPAGQYNKRLSVVMKKVGVNFMNMLAPLQIAYKKHGKALFIPWDGHNTEVANRVIARQVATAVQAMSTGVQAQTNPGSSHGPGSR